MATASLAHAASREQPTAAESAAPTRNAGFAIEPSFAPDPWATLVDAGLKLVESLGAPRSDDAGAAHAPPQAWLETDPQTGRTYIKVPAPEPETLKRLAGTLLAELRPR